MKIVIHCFSITNALIMKDSRHSIMIDVLHIINKARVILIIENILKKLNAFYYSFE